MRGREKKEALVHVDLIMMDCEFNQRAHAEQTNKKWFISKRFIVDKRSHTNNNTHSARGLELDVLRS